MEIAESRKKQIAAFYKEEFLRHKCRLECQRPFFQEKTYEEIESVLNRRFRSQKTCVLPSAVVTR